MSGMHEDIFREKMGKQLMLIYDGREAEGKRGSGGENEGSAKPVIEREIKGG